MRTLALVLVCSAAAGAQDSPNLVTRSHDVRMFGQAPARPAPPMIGLLPSADSGPEIERDGEGIGLEASQILELVQAGVEPGTWGNDGCEIEARDGFLVVRQDAATQERVASFLDLLSRQACRRVAVDAEAVLFEPGVLESSGVSAGPLTAADEKTLRSLAADPTRARLVTALRAVVRSGGRAWAGDLNRRAYVRDYLLEIAPRALVADPEVAALTEGALLELRPMLAPDGASVLLEARFTLARPGPDFVHEPRGAAEGRLRLPTCTVLKAGGTFGCPSGRTVLFAGGSSESSEGGRTLAVLVRASSAADPGDGDVPWGRADLRLCLLETLALSAFLNDFPGGTLDLEFEQQGMSPCGILPPEERGAGISADQLAELIQKRTGSDAWSVENARIEGSGCRLVLAAAPGALEAARQVLASAFPRRDRQIGVDAVVVVAPPAVWDQARGGDLGAFVRNAAEGRGARLAGSAQVVGMSGQRFHAFSGRETAYLHSRQAAVATRAAGLDPIIGTLREGLLLDVRPSAAPDGRVHVELEAQFASRGRLEAIPAKRGGLQRASIESLQARGKDWATPGEWRVATEGERESENGREAVALLYRVRILEVR